MDTAAAISAFLAERAPAPVAQYVATGYARVARFVDCTEGYALLTARTVEPEGDPMHGFRVQHLWLMGERNSRDTRIVDRVMSQPELIVQDPVFRRMNLGTGAHRVHHEPDPRRIPGCEASIDATIWEQMQLSDMVKVAYAFHEDCELHLGFHRFPGARDPARDVAEQATPRGLLFSEAECASLLEIVSAASAWARRVAFLTGQLRRPTARGDAMTGPGEGALSPRETEMLVHLLGPEPQKVHASAMGLSEARARELVRGIHAKLGTTNRAELQHSWMVCGATIEAPTPVLGRRLPPRPPATRRAPARRPRSAG